MTPDDTSMLAKPPADPPGPVMNGSSFGRVSIRAWLALIITVSICGNWTANMIMAMMGYTSVNIVIPEPLYSAFTMVLGIYFGQQLKK